MIDYRKLYSKYDKEDLVNTCANLKQNKERLRKEVNRSYIVCDEKDKEIERLNNIIDEQDKELELERKSRQLLTDDLANVCEISLKKENIIKEVREDLYQVVKWCTENKHNEDTIERYLVVDYGTTVGKINEIRTKLDKEVN